MQLTLEKWYQPEKNIGTDEEPNWIDDEEKEPQLLDRAKFYLYRCTLEQYDERRPEHPGRSSDSEDGMAAYRVSDYVYESGVSNGAGPGMVVTGALEGGYVYWFNEFEAPAGFVQPAWPASLSVAFVPDAAQSGNEISYRTAKPLPRAAWKTIPEHGPGAIRYLQVMVDKVAQSTDGTQ